MTATGTPLSYQQCEACRHRWYFTRTFCPACGSDSVLSLPASGRGTLYTSTLVHRAPSEAFRALVPFSIVLVDMEEGFRVMGHGEAGMPLDGPVLCELREIAGRPLPFFRKALRVP